MSTLVAQTISNGTVSTSTANCIQGSAKAWVRFNGSTATIAASYNVSSVTRASTGVYTVNFTNAFSDTNYCAVGAAGSGNANVILVIPFYSVAPATTSAQVVVTNLSGAGNDGVYNSFAFFR